MAEELKPEPDLATQLDDRVINLAMGIAWVDVNYDYNTAADLVRRLRTKTTEELSLFDKWYMFGFTAAMEARYAEAAELGSSDCMEPVNDNTLPLDRIALCEGLGA